MNVKACPASVAIGLVVLLWPGFVAPAQAAGGQLILNMEPSAFGGTMWRVFQTWQTESAKLDNGSIVRVDPFDPREKDAGGFKLKTVTKIIGSEYPPADWTKTDFDDSNWQQPPGATRYLYRALALMCIRGKFEVTDPATAGTLNLSLSYHGGVVVYLNGQEIGRGSMPQGKISDDTLADEYPKEAYVNAGGKLLSALAVFNVQNTEGYSWNDLKKVPALAARVRKLTVTIPAGSLHKGVNVLAIEVHRSPANPVMFTTTTKELESALRMDNWWNRNEVMDVKLTATGASGGIVPNASRPKGLEIWNYPAMETVDDMRYGDPNETLKPIKLFAARNGVFTGELMVSSTGTVKGLQVAVADLKTEDGMSIPAADVKLGYGLPTGPAHWTYARAAQLDFDVLNPAPADPIAPLKANDPAGVTMQPIWFSVNVPRDAKPGVYAGKVTINIDGQKPVETPLQIKVVDWTLPDPNDFKTYVGLVESPDTVAMQYNVKMWSDEHWKLLDKVFEMLAQLGDKEIYIEVVRQSAFGNEESMVRWVKQADGSYKLDFSIVEKYLDLAMKHLGKVPTVCFETTEPNPRNKDGLLFTEMDPKTGELKDAVGPKWGTAESRAFLKPLFDGLKDILTKRGIGDSLMVGVHAGEGAAGPQASPQMVSDITAVCPTVKWVRVSHYWFDGNPQTSKTKYGRIALVGGVIGVFWDPDRDKPFYGWLNPDLVVVFPRTTNGDYAGTRLGQDSGLPESRFFAEAALTSGRRRPVVVTKGNISGEMGYDTFKGLRGVGPFGADFWPVLKGANGDKPIIGRYGDGYPEGGWGTVSLNAVMQSLIAPGKDGPIPTMRSQTMRESLQEAEARILIQNAVLDEKSKAKLGPDLAKRAADLCYDRTQGLRYASEFWEAGIMAPGPWEEKSEKIYEMAAEVGKKLGGGK